MEAENEIILYQPNETVKLEVRLENDNVWLTQAQMADLFDKNQSVIARHISNVFKEGELDKESNMQILHNTLKDLGKKLFAFARMEEMTGDELISRLKPET